MIFLYAGESHWQDYLVYLIVAILLFGFGLGEIYASLYSHLHDPYSRFLLTTSTLLPFFVVKLVYSFKDQVPAWRHMIIIVLECVIIGVVLPVLANLSNSFIIKHDFSDYYDARLKRPTVEEYKELNLDSEFRSKIFGRYGISFAALPSSLMATFSIFISPYSFLHARGTQGALTWVENFFFWAAFISLAAIVILVLTYLCIIPLIKIIRKR